jgi:hypothetical protein
MFHRGWFGAVCGPLIGCTLASSAAADDTDRLATATSLFQAAQTLVQEARAAEACPIFAESYRLEPANGTLINLADCYERIGRTATAWLTFRDVAKKSAAAGQDERADVARKRVSQLEPRLSRLRISVGHGSSVAGLVVTRDSLELMPAALDIAVPVDPGEHRIAATAPNHESWGLTVRVAGEGTTKDVFVPRLTPEPTASPQPPTQSATPVRWQYPVAFTAVALGGAALIAGVALGAAAKSEADDAECDSDNLCTPAGLEQRDDAVALGNIGTGIGIAGAALGVIGFTIFVLSTPDDDDGPRRSIAAELSVGMGFHGATVTGRF